MNSYSKLSLVCQTVSIAVAILFFTIKFEFANAQDTFASDRIMTIVYSPAGDRVAIGYGTGVIKIASVTNGQFLLTLVSHTAAISSLAWNSMGTQLVSGSLNPDNNVRIWNTTTGQLVRELVNVGDNVQAVSWTPNNRQIIVMPFASDNSVFDTSTGAFITTISTGTTYSLNWSPDGTKIAFPQLSGGIAIHNATNYQNISYLGASSGEISGPITNQIISMAWKPDSSAVAVGTWGGNVLIWNVSSGQLTFEQRGNDYQGTDRYLSFVKGLRFSNDGTKLISISGDGSARTWNASTGHLLESNQLPSPIYAVDWSPDGTKLAYGGNDGTLQIVSVADVLSATPAPTTTPTAQDLISVLRPAGCTTTCFIGIQPGVTTQSEVKAIFASRNIQYIVDTGVNNDEPNGIYSWEMPTTNMSFSTYDGAPVSAFITFSKGMVRQVVVGLSIPVKTIVAAFGQPNELKTDDGDYYMFYPQQGVFFLLRTYPSLSYTTVFVLVDSSAMNRWLNNTSISPVLTCPQRTDLCSVKTATPVASATSGR